MSSTSTSPKDAVLAAALPGTEPISATGVGRRPSERRVGKYHILAELGRGGTATVYLAVARGAGGVSKLVVLKALLPEFAEESSAVSSFLDEARLAAQLNHPNVVQTYEVGTEANYSVIVMEYLEGHSLSRLTRCCEAVNRRLPDGMHFKILIELLAGLHYAHELKSYEGVPLELVHRDVSPQNVFVTYDGQVKVLDFGIAKASTSSTHTAAGVLKGKISYMAPEQMSGSPVDRRADIFSVGCMLWAAAAGTKLWKDYSYVQIVRFVLAGRIPSPRQVNPYCPEELEHIVMKALAHDPANRYATAFDLQMALEAFTENNGLTVKRRAIGALVTELFAETRADLQSSIERELAALVAMDSLTSDPPELGPMSSLRPVPLEMTEPPSLTRRAPRGRWILWAAFAVGLLASAGVLILARRTPQVQRAEHAAVEPAPALKRDPVTTAVSAARAAQSATVRFHVTPETAVLTLDGAELADGVREQTLPIDGKTHELRLAAPGHQSETIRFEATRTETLRVALSPVPASSARQKLASTRDGAVNRHRSSPTTKTPSTTLPPSTPAPEPETAPTNEAATQPAPRAPGCHNPFYVDSEGIKRVRTECL